MRSTSESINHNVSINIINCGLSLIDALIFHDNIWNGGKLQRRSIILLHDQSVIQTTDIFIGVLIFTYGLFP